MNKTDLINAIAEASGLSKTDASSALKATLDAVAAALERGEKISISGFGSFNVCEKAARTGFNPLTRQNIEIPARKTIKFKPGSELSEKIK